MGLKFTIVLEVLRIVPMYCLHHVGWIRGAFTHSSLPSQFFLGNVRSSLNQHNFFPVPRLGHTKIMQVWSVNSSSLPGCEPRTVSVQAGPCLSPYRHLKVDGAACGARGASSGHLLNRRFVTLQGMAEWIGRSHRDLWLWLSLPGLPAGGLCVG